MTVYIIIQIINWVCNILIIVMLARSVLSWIVYSGNQYNPTIGKIYQFLTGITEPIVAPVRRFLARFVNTGPVDFAPLAVFFIVMIVRRILTSVLIGFM